MQLSRENACAGFDLKAGLAGLFDDFYQTCEVSLTSQVINKINAPHLTFFLSSLSGAK
jgi:hypothetical protein